MKKFIRPLCCIFLSMMLSGCVTGWFLAYGAMEVQKLADYVSNSIDERKKKAFYDKETPEQKELRKKNNVFCTNLAEKPENREKDGRWSSIYENCMKERGSPLYDY